MERVEIYEPSFSSSQFILCLIGSMIGIVLGAALGSGFAWAVSKFMQDFIEWPSVITIEFGVDGCIGWWGCWRIFWILSGKSRREADAD